MPRALGSFGCEGGFYSIIAFAVYHHRAAVGLDNRSWRAWFSFDT
jgi:hypothetical protein